MPIFVNILWLVSSQQGMKARDIIVDWLLAIEFQSFSLISVVFSLKVLN